MTKHVKVNVGATPVYCWSLHVLIIKYVGDSVV